MRKPQGLTKAQIAAFFRAANAAARALGEPLDAYRKRVMKEVCNVTSTKQLNRTHDFDSCMARFAEDAGDDANAIKYALATSTRLRRLVIDAADALAPGNALGYVAGVIIQSHTVRGYDQPALATRLASDIGWLDLTNPQLRRILAMLKTHLLRK